MAAADEDVDRLRSFGENIGWAFQVVDDILDQEESSAALGKTAGKDQAQQKATYPALYGLEKSREIAADLEAKALSELDCYGERAARLAPACRISRRAPFVTPASFAISCMTEKKTFRGAPPENAKRRPKPGKARLDVLIVERGLAPSRERAQALLLAGQIRVNGAPAEKPGTQVATDAQIELSRRNSPLCKPRRPETRRRARRFRRHAREPEFASMPEAPLAALPIACCNTARERSMPWT